MAGAGRKTFVAGDPLSASEVNTYLMDQAVMVFADSTARSSAIPSPSEGMISYLSDSNTINSYDGSSWGSLNALPNLQLVRSVSIGSAISTLTVSDVFSADYDNYLLMLTGTVTNSPSDTLSLQFRDSFTGTYQFATRGHFYTGTNIAAVGGPTSFMDVFNCTAVGSMGMVNIYNPFLPIKTNMDQIWIGTEPDRLGYYQAGTHNIANSWTGFILRPANLANTMTGGILAIYGYGI
jgi:hypothetical protein